MGRKSDVQNVAAVAIQRWFMRRSDSARSVRLLAALHVLKLEEETANSLVSHTGAEVHSSCSLSVNFEKKAGSRDNGFFSYVLAALNHESGSGVINQPAMNYEDARGDAFCVTCRLVCLLVDVADMYARRLRRENYKLLKEREGRTLRREQDCGDSQRKEEDKHIPGGVALLSDCILLELMEAAVARAPSSSGCPESCVALLETRLKSGFGAAGTAWLASATGKWSCSTKQTSARENTIGFNVSDAAGRPLWVALVHALRRVQVVAPRAFPSGNFVPSASLLEDTLSVCEAHTSDDEGKFSARTGSSTRVKDAAFIKGSKSEDPCSVDVDTSDSSSDYEYDDEKYLERQKRRDEARMIRIAQRLEMDKELVLATKEGYSAVGAGSRAAMQKRLNEDEKAQNEYVQLFGNMDETMLPGSVLKKSSLMYGNLRRARWDARRVKTGGTDPTAEHFSSCHVEEPSNSQKSALRICVVCELPDNEEVLRFCSCGSWVHSECASYGSGNVARCSLYCA
ncbi:hypothetical protein ERJ75_000784100 [Trypanosoma vivax]|uniref:Uncharacterized protein n=1 Tax=Trypanosoma vivax (strain Y486) TaxID=1055687 RepID=G0TWD5_TRYVY|nr:hypothetical protein TRVL_02774 [Trypanosoma vivax]KAH8613491.1 hypothetical protein ERJ75_000784100 [Trypanosoma vivax]CCC48273.1 conserved hypothetical protein [Trypanosoma vivax Y486]